MRWTQSIFLSLAQRYFQNPVQELPMQPCSTLQDIRSTMLLQLKTHCANAYQTLHWRVTYADDLQSLWYLRGDVMAAIAAYAGEATARKVIDDISGMFHGLLPKALTVKTSALRV